MKRLVLFFPLLFAGCAVTPVTLAPKPAVPAERHRLPPIAPSYGESNPAPTPATAPGVKHFVSIVGLNPAMQKKYRDLHANVWPEVVAAIRKAHISNYRIHVAELAGRFYLISSFDYTGTDPEVDFGSFAKDPTTRDKWWPLTDACQIRLPGTPAGAQWLNLEPVMHLP